MDLLSQHEAFLRAIFDAPADDTPRLVYADFLQENDDEDRAEFIRLSCEAARLYEDDPRRIDIQAEFNAIVRKHTSNSLANPWPWKQPHVVRGFPEPFEPIPLIASYQEDLDGLRRVAVAWSPEWFGAKTVKFSPDETRLGPVQIDLFLSLPFIQQVTAWDLSGLVEEELTAGDPDTFNLTEIVQTPVITTAGVEALSRHRGARRITSLDLRNNSLDNDAARALVKSPYLGNLKRLQLLEGNRFRGKVWQQVIERFGEDVVG